MTSTGLVYLQSEKAAKLSANAAVAALGGKTVAAGHIGTLPTAAGAAKPPPKNGTAGGNRKLMTVGNGRDDRWEVTSTNRAHTWPFRTVGHIVTGCSGTLVDRHTVLTAGHVSRRANQ